MAVYQADKFLEVVACVSACKKWMPIWSDEVDGLRIAGGLHLPTISVQPGAIPKGIGVMDCIHFMLLARDGDAGFPETRLSSLIYVELSTTPLSRAEQ